MKGFIDRMNQNPVFIKDTNISRRIGGRKKWDIPSIFWYISLLVVPLIIGIIWVFKLGENIIAMKWIFMGICYLQTICFSFRSVSRSWGLISKEREMQTYGNLLSTAMTARDIILGKFWVAFYPLARELTIGFLIFFIMGLLGGFHAFSIFLVYLFNLIHIAFFAMAGLYYSTVSSSSSAARGASMGVLAFLTFGSLVIMGSLGVLIDSFLSGSGRTTFAIILGITVALTITLNPLANVYIALGDFDIHSISTEGQLLIGHIGSLVCIGIYALVGWLVFRKTVKKMGEIPE